MTTIEMLARDRKVSRLIDAMDRTASCRMTAARAERLTLAEMTAILERAGVRTPSKLTMAAVADRLLERDRDWEEDGVRFVGRDINRDAPGAQD